MARLPPGGPAGMLRHILGLTDTARFRSDDPHELVLASLACPLCLRSHEVEWRLEGDGYDPWARCACRRCAKQWMVYLSPQQALRLGLMAVGAP